MRKNLLNWTQNSINFLEHLPHQQMKKKKIIIHPGKNQFHLHQSLIGFESFLYKSGINCEEKKS